MASMTHHRPETSLRAHFAAMLATAFLLAACTQRARQVQEIKL